MGTVVLFILSWMVYSQMFTIYASHHIYALQMLFCKNILKQ